MPSPFPGMDPYLESPDIWPDFHDALAGEIRRELNRILPKPYYARLEMRPELGVIEEQGISRRIVPDLTVVRHPRGTPAAPGTAVQELPRHEVSQSYELSIPVEFLRHQFVEIRDSARGHKLITLIEIVSPSNKLAGPDRRAYSRKQREVLESDANLIELDLVRSGERLLTHVEVAKFIETLDPPPHYLVVVNRASRRRDEEIGSQLFAWTVSEPLPCIPIALRAGEEEPVLDLQYVFQQAYESGPYQRGAIDYAELPDPPLDEPFAGWAQELLRAQGS